MLPLDDFLNMLDDIAGEIPREFFKELNGGIVLRPELKHHPKSIHDDLCVMGEYHVSSTMGRFIYIYFGSFAKVYADLDEEALKAQVRKTVLHEFTHHFESLAGEKDLEIEDAKHLAGYINKHKGN